MKHVIKKIGLTVLSPIYNRKLITTLRSIHNTLCWRTFSKELKRIGDNSHVGEKFHLYGAKYIEIGENFSAGKGLNLQAWDYYAGESYTPKLIIGDNVMLTDYIQISCAHEVKIGNNVLMGQNVYISDNSHGDFMDMYTDVPPAERKLTSKGPVIVEDDVWIGRNVTIMSGVTIGAKAIIGAGAVVTKDVPQCTVVAGVPAVVIKKGY